MGLWWGHRGLLRLHPNLQHFASLRTNAFSPSYRPLGFTVGKHQRSEQKLSANWTQPTASLSPKSKRTRPMADCSGLLRDIEGEGDRWGGLTYFLWRSSTLRNIPTYIQHFLTKTKHFHKENWTFRYFILTILSVLQRNTPTSSRSYGPSPFGKRPFGRVLSRRPRVFTRGFAAQGRWVGTRQLRRVLGRGHPRAQAPSARRANLPGCWALWSEPTEAVYSIRCHAFENSLCFL